MKLYLEEVKKGNKDYKEHWEKFQLNMKCCGVNYYTDWTDISLRAEVENKSKFPLHMECLVLF